MNYRIGIISLLMMSLGAHAAEQDTKPAPGEWPRYISVEITIDDEPVRGLPPCKVFNPHDRVKDIAKGMLLTTLRSLYVPTDDVSTMRISSARQVHELNGRPLRVSYRTPKPAPVEEVPKVDA